MPRHDQMLGRFFKVIASSIQRLLKCLQAGYLYRRAMQLLEALQIVNGSDAIGEGVTTR